MHRTREAFVYSEIATEREGKIQYAHRSLRVGVPRTLYRTEKIRHGMYGDLCGVLRTRNFHSRQFVKASSSGREA